MVKNLPANVGDARHTGLIPGSGRSAREGNGYPLEYSCLGNPMAWGVTGRWQWLSRLPLSNKNIFTLPRTLPNSPYHMSITTLLAIYQLLFKAFKSISVYFLQYSAWSESERKWSRSVLSDSLRPHGMQPTRFLHPCDFPGKNTGVDCHFLYIIK